MTMPGRSEIQEIFRRFELHNPAPKTELRYVNHYTLLVAVVLSAQATDIGVNKATEPLFKEVNSPHAMLKLGEEGLKKAIKTIGLFNSKARNIILLSKQLIERHHGEVPSNRAALEALPGVGKKTAAVIMNCLFDEPTIAVDTHVFRVANRLGFVQTSSPDKTEEPLTKKLAALLQKSQMLHAHHWLILHGRYLCTARNPKCSMCYLSDLCPSSSKADAKRD